MGVGYAEVSRSTVYRAINRMEHPREKEQISYRRRRVLEAAWKVVVAGGAGPPKLVFVDDLALHLTGPVVRLLSQRRGGWPPGAARKQGKNTTLVASITLEGMGPSMAVEGSTAKKSSKLIWSRCSFPNWMKGRWSSWISCRPTRELG